LTITVPALMGGNNNWIGRAALPNRAGVGVGLGVAVDSGVGKRVGWAVAFGSALFVVVAVDVGAAVAATPTASVATANEPPLTRLQAVGTSASDTKQIRRPIMRFKFIKKTNEA